MTNKEIYFGAPDHRVNYFNLIKSLIKKDNYSSKIILLSTFILSILLSPLEQRAQSSFELVCRGGGNLHFNYTPFSNFAAQPQIWITFEQASQRVGLNEENIYALMPGQCSCKDRVLSKYDPNRLLVKINTTDFSIQWMQGRVTGISSALYYINNLQDSKIFQSFYVYNDGRGNFIVTSIGKNRF